MCASRYLLLFFVLFPLVLWVFSFDDFSPFKNIASLYFPETVTTKELKEKYARSQLNVLIVPGHDNNSYGTEFKGLKEAELNIILGTHLLNFFLKDPKFNVSISRDIDGEYSMWFQEYMTTHKQKVIDFRDLSKRLISDAKQMGHFVESNAPVEHNPAADNVSLNLYGINKYSNDFGIDIVLHLHFNDYPGRSWTQQGKYSGFSIYVPEGELPNSQASTELAYSIKNHLEEFIASSNFFGESEVVIPDQELIAVGSNASRNKISILLEYDYIYEAQYHTDELRDVVLKELALLTYQGVKNYYKESTEQKTSILPYTWTKDIKKLDRSIDVLALQTALRKEGLYPPKEKTLSDCPINGYYGSCTEESVKTFQEKYSGIIIAPFGLSTGTGNFGKNTREHLTNLYGK